MAIRPRRVEARQFAGSLSSHRSHPSRTSAHTRAADAEYGVAPGTPDGGPAAPGFSLIVTLVTGLAIGLLQPWQATGVHVHVQEALKDASRGSTGTGQIDPVVALRAE